MENIYLDEKEEKLLDDLLLYNRQIKELFKDQKNYQTIKLIDDIIDNKLNNLTDKTIIKLLNHLFEGYHYQKPYNSLLKVLNNDYKNIEKSRLGLDLIKHLSTLNYETFKTFNSGLKRYANYNFYAATEQEHNEINYYIVKDQLDSYLMTLANNQDINPKRKKQIINHLLYIYKDNYYDNIPYHSLASRFDTLDAVNNHNYIASNLRGIILNPIFYETASIMLNNNDTDIDNKKLETLELHKLYLSTTLKDLSENELDITLDKFSEFEMNTDFQTKTIAYDYIYDAIYEKEDMLDNNEKSL